MNTLRAPQIKILEDTDIELEPLYSVVIHNDDVTPMDFVTRILTHIFQLGIDRATEIMLAAHIKGTAYVQTLPKAEAEEKTSKAHAAANAEKYPLRFSIEPE